MKKNKGTPKEGGELLLFPTLPPAPSPAKGSRAKVFAGPGGAALLECSLPEDARPEDWVGRRVEIASSEGSRRGIVCQVVQAEAEPPKWHLFRVLDPEPILSRRLFELARQLSRLYCAPLPVALKTALPSCLWETPSERMRCWIETLPSAFEEDGAKETGDGTEEKRALLWLAERGRMLLSEAVRTSGWSRSFWERLAREGCVVLRKLPREGDREGSLGQVAKATQPPLTPAQKDCVQVLLDSLAKGSQTPILLYGVTGSGKTEVYLRAIEEVLEKGGSALLLVPEIALAPQLLERLKKRLEPRWPVAVWHSGLAPAVRALSWWRVQRGEVNLVLGTRSSLFLPFRKLSLIILDEEHDPSYKQEEGLRYHARQAALLRGRLEGALVVLGSATPSLESWYCAKNGKYRLLELPQRTGQARMPVVHVVDLRLEGRRHSREEDRAEPWAFLAPFVRKRVQGYLDQKKQILVYVNRRGYAAALQCLACGERLICPRCSVALTFHKALAKLLCHYCGYLAGIPGTCPRCGSGELRLLGKGTERVEEGLRELFPGARILRVDSDSLRERARWEQAIQAFQRKEVDILVGTQLLSKGLDFPNLGCVVVLEWDLLLHLPDFRATERAFQQLTQVAGRAGRAGGDAEVFVQTRCPHHPAIQFARHHDFKGFAESELELRGKLLFPPYRQLILLRWEGRNQERTRRVSEQARERIMVLLAKLAEASEVFPAPIEKIRGRYRYLLLLKTDTPEAVAQKLFPEQSTLKDSRVRLEIDVDPFDFC
jgi:primosomal protein N' (replication factor Y)